MPILPTVAPQMTYWQSRYSYQGAASPPLGFPARLADGADRELADLWDKLKICRAELRSGNGLGGMNARSGSIHMASICSVQAVLWDLLYE